MFMYYRTFKDEMKLMRDVYFFMDEDLTELLIVRKKLG